MNNLIETTHLLGNIIVNDRKYLLNATLQQDNNWYRVCVRFPADYPITPFHHWSKWNGRKYMADIVVYVESNTIWLLRLWDEVMDHPTLSKDEIQSTDGMVNRLWLLLLNHIHFTDIRDHYMVRVETEEVEQYEKYGMSRVQTDMVSCMEIPLCDLITEMDKSG